MVKCSICGEEKNIEDFKPYYNKRYPKLRRKYCKKCSYIVGDKLNIKRRYYHYKYRAKQVNMEFDISFPDFENMIQNKCSYCNDNKNIGIDRIDNSKGYIYGNITPCCSNCNYTKAFFERKNLGVVKINRKAVIKIMKALNI